MQLQAELESTMEELDEADAADDDRGQALEDLAGLLGEARAELKAEQAMRAQLLQVLDTTETELKQKAAVLTSLQSGGDPETLRAELLEAQEHLADRQAVIDEMTTKVESADTALAQTQADLKGAKDCVHMLEEALGEAKSEGGEEAAAALVAAEEALVAAEAKHNAFVSASIATETKATKAAAAMAAELETFLTEKQRLEEAKQAAEGSLQGVTLQLRTLEQELQLAKSNEKQGGESLAAAAEAAAAREEATAARAAAESALQEKASQLQAALAQKRQVEEAQQAAEGSLQALSREMEQKQAEIVALQQQNAASSVQGAALQQQLAGLTEELRASQHAAQQHQEMTAKGQRLEQALAGSKNEISEYQAALNAVRLELEAAQRQGGSDVSAEQLAESEEARRDIQEELTQLRQEHAALKVTYERSRDPGTPGSPGPIEHREPARDGLSRFFCCFKSSQYASLPCYTGNSSQSRDDQNNLLDEDDLGPLSPLPQGKTPTKATLTNKHVI